MIGEARDTSNLSRAVRSCFRLGLRLVTIRLVTRNMTRLYPSQTLVAKYSVNFHNSQVRLKVYPLEMSDLPPLLLFPPPHADDL